MVPAFIPGGLIFQQKDLFRALDGAQRFFRIRLMGERIVVRLRQGNFASGQGDARRVKRRFRVNNMQVAIQQRFDEREYSVSVRRLILRTKI